MKPKRFFDQYPGAAVFAGFAIGLAIGILIGLAA
jgi:hypothetical protein